MINFTELGGWENFEELSEELLKKEGLETRRLGRGPGQIGKDIIAWENVKGPLSLEKRKWLVECKFSDSKSAISEKEIYNISDRVRSQNAFGYFLITSARMGVNLEKTLFGLKEQSEIGIMVWDRSKIIEKIILSHDIFRKYFPNSCENWVKNNRIILISQISLIRSPLGNLLSYLYFFRDLPEGKLSKEGYREILNTLISQLKELLNKIDEQLRIISRAID